MTALPEPRRIVWPNGARCAAAITFDMDADSLIHISRPLDGHDRLYPISMGRYGPDVAVPRILETYRRLGLRQSFFVPGWCIETYPDTVRAIADGGHEIGHHGHLHEDPTVIGAQATRHWFERALESHERVLGLGPKGYRAPVYNVTQAVIDLLVEHGFDYDSSLMGDDLPYRLRTQAGSLIEMPVHWGTDDWPPFAHYDEIGYMMPVRGPTQGLAPFWEEFEAQYETGGFWIGIWHPFLTGRLARWRVVERWLEEMLARGDVWVATLGEIAAHVAAQDGLREDRLPYYDRPQNLTGPTK